MLASLSFVKPILALYRLTSTCREICCRKAGVDLTTKEVLEIDKH